MNMHYCSCQINLAGQGVHIVQILPTEPMSWPEVQLMMTMHGDENVYDIKPVSIVETNQIEEKRRLQGKYNHKHAVIEQVFPGRNPASMQMLMPGEAEDQPRADEYGIPKKTFDDDDEEVLGRDPPAGPAVMRPGIPRPFPATPRLET
jgi:hypothetical protein